MWKNNIKDLAYMYTPQAAATHCSQSASHNYACFLLAVDTSRRLSAIMGCFSRLTLTSIRKKRILYCSEKEKMEYRKMRILSLAQETLLDQRLAWRSRSWKAFRSLKPILLSGSESPGLLNSVALFVMEDSNTQPGMVSKVKFAEVCLGRVGKWKHKTLP